MKIGIIGTGLMGRALGVQWARAGHEVLFGSRDPAKATAAAKESSPSARSGDFDAAASFGDVILYTVRDVLPTRLLRNPGSLSGKIVIDCNNRDLGSDARPADFNFDTLVTRPSITERLATDIPSARVVKAFNTIPFTVIELAREKLAREELARKRVSVFLSSDDARAKETVRELAEVLGFEGVDCGPLERAHFLDTLADFVRFQIGALGRGMFATVSLRDLKEETR